MSKPGKIALLLATLWPCIYVVLFLGFIFTMMLYMSRQQGIGTETGGVMPGWFVSLFAVHMLTILGNMALTVFYIINVFRNERVAPDKKWLWAAVIFFGNMIAMPVYWYLYIWRESDA